MHPSDTFCAEQDQNILDLFSATQAGYHSSVTFAMRIRPTAL